MEIAKIGEWSLHFNIPDGSHRWHHIIYRNNEHQMTLESTAKATLDELLDLLMLNRTAFEIPTSE